MHQQKFLSDDNEDQRKKLVRYHRAIAKGRHPNSFGRKVRIWNSIDTSNGEIKSMTTGGHLSNVLYGDQEIKSTINVQTMLGSPSRTIHSRSLPKIKRDSIASRKSASSCGKHLGRFQTQQATIIDKLDRIAKIDTTVLPDETERVLINNGMGSTLLNKISHEHCLCQDDMLDDPSEILYYGNSIAIEVRDMDWLCISERNSQFRCREWIRSVHKPMVDPRAIFNFEIIQLGNPFSDAAVKWGDKVWLKVTSGPGTPDWKAGSVIGVQIYEPPVIETVIHRGEENKEVKIESSSNNNTAELVGIPKPIRAYVPEVDADIIRDIDYHISKTQLIAPLTVWRISHPDNIQCQLLEGKPVHNLAHVFFEHEGVYMAPAMSDTHRLILKQLDQMREGKEGSRVDRRGIFRIHLVKKPVKKIKKVNQFAVMENMMYRARQQIAESKINRSGSKAPRYEGIDVPRGDEFVNELRNRTCEVDWEKDKEFYHNVQDHRDKREKKYLKSFSTFLMHSDLSNERSNEEDRDDSTISQVDEEDYYPSTEIIPNDYCEPPPVLSPSIEDKCGKSKCPSVNVCNLCRIKYGGINLCQMNLSIEANLTTCYHTERYGESLCRKYHIHESIIKKEDEDKDKFMNRYSSMLDEEDKDISENLSYDAKLKRYELTVRLLKRKLEPVNGSISGRSRRISSSCSSSRRSMMSGSKRLSKISTNGNMNENENESNKFDILKSPILCKVKEEKSEMKEDDVIDNNNNKGEINNLITPIKCRPPPIIINK